MSAKRVSPPLSISVYERRQKTLCSRHRALVNRLPLFVGEIRNATRTQPKILVRNLIEQEGNHNALTCQLNGAVQRKRERGEMF